LRPDNKNRENNPMHSSRLLVGIAVFRIFDFTKSGLTRRAKQGHDGIMAAGAQQAFIRTHHLDRRPIGSL
jgi:hypothetical protein